MNGKFHLFAPNAGFISWVYESPHIMQGMWREKQRKPNDKADLKILRAGAGRRT